MSDLLQWAITTIVAILGILIGRAWQKHDRTIEKDKKVFETIIGFLPQQTVNFLEQDFGSAFRIEKLDNLRNLTYLTEKPNFFFIDRKLEKTRKEFFVSIRDFLDTCNEKADNQFGLKDE